MREDYRDETLLGFIFVFVLIPIMMKQAHDSTLFGGAMFDVPEHRDGFWNWVGFFGIELAKAVPIVDWAEIYQIQANAGGELIAMKSESSRHAVFMARATVDLVLIASLLQAISISNRNRQQKQLFRAGAGPRNAFDPGLINRLDKFVEESELRKAINACLNPGHPTVDRSTTPNQAHDEIFNLRKLSDPHLIDFRRYNPDRLLEIYGESKDVNVRAFIAAISYERPDLTLKSRIQLLEEYAENGRNELDLYAVLQRILSDRAANPQQNAPDLEKLRSIMLHVRRRQGLKDFKRSVLELISEANAKDQAIEVLGDIAGRSDPDDFQYARVDAIKMIEKIGCENRNLVAHSTAVLKDILRRKPAASVVHAANRALANISSCS